MLRTSYSRSGTIQTDSVNEIALDANQCKNGIDTMLTFRLSPYSVTPTLTEWSVIPIAFSKSLSCRQLCLGIITMHYLEQMSRRPQLPEGFNDVDF
ncbi:hypothetical protein, partial [Endozoicomonas atrinae]|uniref:hypothetical protein n=1 Tax=Endozoicomonas atrinae TaxID=1333660 RepID=UPI001112D3D5